MRIESKHKHYADFDFFEYKDGINTIFELKRIYNICKEFYFNISIIENKIKESTNDSIF